MSGIHVYTDASVDYDNNTAGIGFVVLDNTDCSVNFDTKSNNILFEHSRRISYCSPVKAEWIAIIKAVELVKTQFEAECITVHTDCHSISQITDGDSNPDSNLSHGMNWWFQNVTESVNVTVEYIRRERNMYADALARSSH